MHPGLKKNELKYAGNKIEKRQVYIHNARVCIYIYILCIIIYDACVYHREIEAIAIACMCCAACKLRAVVDLLLAFHNHSLFECI